MERIMNALVALLGLALIGFGLYSIFAVQALEPMVGLTAEGVMGNSEMRAIYGGFLVQGLLLIYALVTPGVRAPVLMVIGLIWAGYILMRLVSIAFDGFAPALTAALASEAVVVVILLSAAAMARRPVAGNPS